MSKKNYAPQVEFAKRHIDGDISTFDAASAVYRLDILLDDVEIAKEHLNSVLEKGPFPAFYEFVAYYQVGIVTCLEWHAKSRIYDLIRYYPKEIEPNDIKQSLNNTNIVQMVSEGLTVAHLIAGSINVSSSEKYLTIIDRVLKATDASITTKDLVSKIENFGSELSDLYTDRNSLVHEISIADIGHRNIRDYRDFDQILHIGRKVQSFIKSVEFELTKTAPEDFPNLLDSEGFEAATDDVWLQKIYQIENRIVENASEGDDGYSSYSPNDWNEQFSIANKYLKSELEFIDDLHLPGERYYDMRDKFRSGLLQTRYHYLSLLEKEVT